jgi:hypothetical protein
MIMESSHFAYKEGSVSTLATELPPDVDRQRIRFTEQCLWADFGCSMFAHGSRTGRRPLPHETRAEINGRRVSQLLSVRMNLPDTRSNTTGLIF